MDKRERINYLLKILNGASSELVQLVPETEDSFRKFKNEIEHEYWKNNQLSLF